jgi:hypothetical protein
VELDFKTSFCELGEAYSSRYFEVNRKSCLKDSKAQRAKSEGVAREVLQTIPTRSVAAGG